MARRIYQGSRYIGRGIFKRTWCSVCLVEGHIGNNTECDNCMRGMYRNDLFDSFGDLLYRFCPFIWSFFMPLFDHHETHGKQDNIVLSQRDSEILIKMLNDPQGPNEALRKAAERYKELYMKEEK